MPPDEVPSRQAALDWLFARMAAGPVGLSTPVSSLPDAEDLATTSAQPEIRSPEDLTRASDWLRRERQRLEAYTRAQLDRIREEHQALVQQKYQNEQSLILRSQQIARQEQLMIERVQQERTAPALAEALEEARKAREREESMWKARMAQLESRFTQLDRAALASEQRQAEIDDMADRLLQESDERERALDERERELAMWQADLAEKQAALKRPEGEKPGA